MSKTVLKKSPVTTIEPSMEIVKATKLEGLQITLAEMETQAAQLPILEDKAKAIVIKDAASFSEAGQLLVNIRAISKAGGARLKPYFDIVKRASDFLKNKKQEHELRATAADELLSSKMETYTRNERLAAEAEQRRINEEKRKEAQRIADEQKKAALEKAELDRKQRVADIKAMLKRGEIGKREAAKLLKDCGAMEEAAKEQAEIDAEAVRNNVQEAKVLPNTPTVAGLRKTRQYKTEVVDAEKFLAAYRANPTGPLAKFVCIDVQELNKEARNVKDSAKMDAMYPGTHATDDDNI